MEVSFKNVQHDYIFIRDLPDNQGVLACHYKRRHQHAIIRKSGAAAPLEMLEAFSAIHHPNVADIFGVYFHAGELYIVGEHLAVSLVDLGFEDRVPEEWEMATIVKEVRCIHCRYRPCGAHCDRSPRRPSTSWMLYRTTMYISTACAYP